MKRIKQLLATDTVLIVVSVLSAILLWYYGYSISNPIETKPYTMQLNLINTGKLDSTGKFLRNKENLENTNITVRIRAPRKTHTELNQISDQLTAYVDFAVSDLLYAPESAQQILTEVQVSLPDKYNNQSDLETVTVVSRDPLTVTVQYDNIITKTLPIGSPTLTNLDLPVNFEVANIVCNPKIATATGPSTEINNIDKYIIDLAVVTDRDLTAEGMPNDYTEKGVLIAVDKNQRPITENITLSINEVEVSYSIKKEKRLPIQTPVFVGEPAAGYALHPLFPLSYSPQTIDIKGPKEAVDSAVSIQLDPIDITGMTSDDTVPKIELYEYLLKINKQLEFVNTNNTEVTVTPRIEVKVIKEYHYYTSRIDTLNYDPETMRIPSGTLTTPLIVSSVKSLMDEFSVFENVSASVDCSGLADMPPGEYELPVTITLARGYNLLSEEPRLTVTVVDANTPTETEPPETEIPESENNNEENPEGEGIEAGGTGEGAVNGEEGNGQNDETGEPAGQNPNQGQGIVIPDTDTDTGVGTDVDTDIDSDS